MNETPHLKKLNLHICLLFLLYLPGSKVTFIDFQHLQERSGLSVSGEKNDTLYVVNFWATWCDPCLRELPAFENACHEFRNRKVKFIFVSLNARREINMVERFVDTHHFISEVYLLNATNSGDWIDLVDSSWSGTIPATVMYYHSKKVYFCEQEFTSAKLLKLINTKLKQK